MRQSWFLVGTLLHSARGDWKRAIAREYLASRLLNFGYPFEKMRHGGRYQVLLRSSDPSSRERYGCSLCCLLLCFRTDILSSQYRACFQVPADPGQKHQQHPIRLGPDRSFHLPLEDDQLLTRASHVLRPIRTCFWQGRPVCLAGARWCSVWTRRRSGAGVIEGHDLPTA